MERVKLNIFFIVAFLLHGCMQPVAQSVNSLKKEVVSLSKKSLYGDNFTSNEKLVTLTDYLIQKQTNFSKPTYPPKPQKDDPYYEEALSFYQQEVQRLNHEYNDKISNLKRTLDEIKKDAFLQAFSHVYGKPYLEPSLLYNADEEKMYATLKSTKSDLRYQLVINVPKENEQGFKKKIEDLEIEIIFDLKSNSYSVQNIIIHQGFHKYNAFLRSNFGSFQKINLAMKADDFKYIQAVQDFEKISKRNSYNDLKAYLNQSDAIPMDQSKWLFVIGIEKYAETDPVIYSSNSANLFVEVIQKRLGVPQRNTRVLIDERATGSRIDYMLKDMLRRVKKGDTIIFYYSGHGIPIVSQNNEPYMLAQDMNPAYLSDDRFKLKNIYKVLSNSQADKIFVFIDSCFSGATDNKSLVKGVAAARMKSKKVAFDQKKMFVMNAGSGIQYSNKFDEKQNRLFSYYLMRGLINDNKNLDQLFQYVRSNVQAKSFEMGMSYEQVPVYEGNIKLTLH